MIGDTSLADTHLESEMSSPTSSTHAEETAAADLKLRADLATAAERRARERPNHESNAQSAEERTLRLNFRRAIDPGIVRPNSEEKAEAAIKVHSARNVLSDSDGRLTRGSVDSAHIVEQLAARAR